MGRMGDKGMPGIGLKGHDGDIGDKGRDGQPGI